MDRVDRGDRVTGDGPRRRPRDDEPLVPDRASEDRDEVWGDRPGDDDERYLREVPPHW